MSSDNVLVSIVSISLNCEKTIQRTINSLLGQTYKNIELIHIDGKSEDNTMRIINKFKKRFAKIVTEKDGGIFDAYNKGIGNAKGDLIGIINGNDYYDLNAVDEVVKAYKKYGDTFFYFGNQLLFNSHGEVYGRRVVNTNSLFFMRSGSSIPHPTVFIPKKIYDQVGLFNTQYRIAADYDFLYRLVKVSKVNFKYINKNIAFFGSGGVSSNIPKAARECHLIRLSYNFSFFESYMYFLKSIIFYLTRRILYLLGLKSVVNLYRKKIIKTHD